MKYLVILGDGMADTEVPALNNKTPLEYASKPNIDSLAKISELGMVKTVPDGFSPGSDVANLSVMGYSPEKYYSGRSPLEAVSMGIALKENDVTFRCNLVTLSDGDVYEDKTMVDYSSDEITTKEAAELISFLAENLNSRDIKFYSGISYRHCMVYNNTHLSYELTPPHDISDKRIADFLPKGENSFALLEMMKKSHELLKNHPVNLDRIKRGLRPANSIWLWGQGKKPKLTDFKEKTGLDGAVISAVDLIKGIGICANMKVIEVKGATGNIHTNFDGKAKAAIDCLKNDCDFVYLHIEAADEAGHRNETENKVKAIELIDEKVVDPVLKAFLNEDISILIMPDHPTPLNIRTHTSDPVPFLLYRSDMKYASGCNSYTEKQAEKTGVFIEKGSDMIKKFTGASHELLY